MTQKYQVKLSMNQSAIVKTGLVLKQGDFGMQIEIEVLDFNVSGTTPQIVFRKPQGAVESTTITVSSNKYTYTLKGTELDIPGRVICDLKLKNSTTQRISSASFMFEVVADTLDGLAEQASSYSDTIEQLLENQGVINEELKSAINNLSLELFDLNNSWHEGQLGANGVDIATSTVWAYTDFLLPVLTAKNIKIYTKSIYRGYIYFYQSNGTFMMRVAFDKDETIMSLPDGTAKIRISLRKIASGDIDIADVVADVKCGYYTEIGIDVEELKYQSEEFRTIKPILNTSYFEIDYPPVKAMPLLPTSDYQSGFTEIHKCPKTLAFCLPDNGSRMYLYIGDLINDQFVIDTDFVYKTSSGRYNYFSSVDNKVIETDGTKYFCYCKIENDASEKIEIIGNNNPFDQDMNTYYSYDPRGYNPDATGDKFTNGITGMSLILPHDCFFVVRPKQTQQGSVLNKNFDIWYYDRKNEIAKKDKIFGYIGNDTSVVLLTLRSNTVGRDLISDVDVYYSKKPTAETQFTSLRGHNLADTIIRLKWKATKNQKMAGMNTEYQKGKVFHGCPYSSRWKDAHFLGFEITPHTFINASNDDKSIFYPPLDDSIVYAGGTGYGLVCSSFTSLISGNSYPQAGDGAFHDSNFQKVKSQNAMPGDVFGSTAAGHVLWVDSIVQGGHVTMEATAPTVSQCIKDSKNAADITNYKTNPEVVAVQKYGYILTPNADYGFDENFLDFSDESMQILGGTVRPYRGDKCVYGSYDKSGADGLGIKITIHTLNDASSDLSGITKAYIEKPSGTIVEVDINGQTVIDIAEIVDEDGTYKLYSNADNTVKEQFRYFDSDDVELSFEADGTAVFSDNRIKYCYCRCNQKPPQYAHIDDGGSHPVVVAAGVKYPYLNSQNITHVFAAIAEDTTPDDSWGRYSCLCHYNG